MLFVVTILLLRYATPPCAFDCTIVVHTRSVHIHTHNHTNRIYITPQTEHDSERIEGIDADRLWVDGRKTRQDGRNVSVKMRRGFVYVCTAGL